MNIPTMIIPNTSTTSITDLITLGKFRRPDSLQSQLEPVLVVDREGLRQQGERVLHRVGQLHVGHHPVHLLLHGLPLRLLLLRLGVVLLPHLGSLLSCGICDR